MIVQFWHESRGDWVEKQGIGYRKPSDWTGTIDNVTEGVFIDNVTEEVPTKNDLRD